MEDLGGQGWRQEGQFRRLLKKSKVKKTVVRLGLGAGVVVGGGRFLDIVSKVEPSGPADRLDAR